MSAGFLHGLLQGIHQSGQSHQGRRTRHQRSKADTVVSIFSMSALRSFMDFWRSSIGSEPEQSDTRLLCGGMLEGGMVHRWQWWCVSGRGPGPRRRGGAVGAGIDQPRRPGKSEKRIQRIRLISLLSFPLITISPYIERTHLSFS